ncbi:MAG: cardiolipin synthase [Pirellulaceae bacterium]|nr:cardiolipin synthase [Pirellulaceae bacterium]
MKNDVLFLNAVEQIGTCLARGIEDGPDVEYDKIRLTILGAIGCASRSLNIITPYFLPDQPLISALNVAAMRGVEVNIILPQKNNLRLVQWACTAQLWQVLQRGCKVWLTPPPFDHTKLMVVDGRVGFTGGMNIRQGCCETNPGKYPLHDLHFKVEGPIVTHMQETFADDWEFCTDERLAGDAWFPAVEQIGTCLARGIEDGPDVEYDKIRLTILGAIGCASRSLNIITPYFLPDQALITALNVAAMRGVDVNIVVPQKNNLRLVQWACTAQLWQVLQRGCKVWLSPPPFDHTKLMVVDDVWSFVGSANWDARSLRLNFEFNVECYDRQLAAELQKIVRQRISISHQTSLEEVDSRTVPVRLRDGIARLAMPYL